MKRLHANDFSLDERLKFLTGSTDILFYDGGGKVKRIRVADGPLGLRYVVNGETRKATVMPSCLNLANTWDDSLAKLSSSVIADECIENDIDILLAPGVNIKRTPLNGRNFEYFSEDPLLAGNMAKEFIMGAEEKGVGTSLKHFALNNSEYERMAQSSEADERTMREIYFKAFEIALKANPSTVMCSYNPVNGVFSAENRKLLKDTLRDKFGFNGVIMSDWGSVQNSARSVKATLDVRMPYDERAFGELMSALESGELSEEEVNESVERVLDLIYKLDGAEKKVETTKKERHEISERIAEEGIVLLKNEDGILPIKSGKIEVAGWFSAHPALSGEGSARVVTDYDIRPLGEEIKKYLLGAEIIVPPLSSAPNAGWYDKYTTTMCYDADAVIYCTGTGEKLEGEGFNRFRLRLPEMDEVRIHNLAKFNKNVIVCIYSGSAVDVSPWIDEVKGVIYVGYAGEGVHEALAKLMCGKANFSGKLSETFPRSLEDTFVKKNMGDGFYDKYDEGVLVGYRYYDTKGIDVAFPFGYGKSYSEFNYSDLKVEKTGETDFKVSFTVENTSDFSGKEIAEVYVREVFPKVTRPEKELAGYKKLPVKAHKKAEFTVDLSFDAFAYYSTVFDDFVVDGGWYEILVGSSSRDIKLKERVKIEFSGLYDFKKKNG